MSTTDHPAHLNTVAPQCPTPDLDPISVPREAVAIMAAGVHTSIGEATEPLVAFAHSSGPHPLCVAAEIAHLADPTGHPHPGLGRVYLRWAKPMHQRRHPPRQVPERVWGIVLAATAPQPGPNQPGPAAVDDTAASARALRVVLSQAPVCRCLSCVVPVAGHHRRPLYCPS